MKKNRQLRVLFLILLLISFCEVTPKYVYHIVNVNGEAPEYFPQDDIFRCTAACIQMYQCYKTSSCPSQSQIMSMADTDDPYGLLNDKEICAYMNNYIQWDKFSVYNSPFSIFWKEPRRLS